MSLVFYLPEHKITEDDLDDTFNSPCMKFWRQLEERGCIVPVKLKGDISGQVSHSPSPTDEALSAADEAGET